MPGRPEHYTALLGGIRTALRRTPGSGDPVVFVHGNPSFSFDWEPLMLQLRRPAIAFDLPGFGHSERPDPGRFDATLGAYSEWVAEALDGLGLERFGLVVHDWGSLALPAACARAERLDRLAVINAVPLFSGYRWHWVARLWRRPGLGERVMATATRAGFAAGLRLARPGLRPMPRGWMDQVWPAFDEGTRAAVLSLYRSADPEALAAAGAGLGRLGCPARVFWGTADPYIGVDWAHTFAAALPDATAVEFERAGHWPWLDRQDARAAINGFLDE